MKTFIALVLVFTFISCSKKDLVDQTAPVTYLVRIAAVDNNGAKTYTSLSRVKSGKVGIEFETSDVTGVKEFDVETSSDGTSFRTARIIAVDLAHPNKIYRDTLALD